MKRYFGFFIKILLSILILFLLSRQIDFAQMLIALRSIDLRFFFLASISIFIASVFMTAKFGVFTNFLADKVGAFRLFLIYWGSDFGSLFSLGAVGSEVYKTLSFQNKKRALAASLSDRVYAFYWYIIFIASLLIPFYFLRDYTLLMKFAAFLPLFVALILLSVSLEGVVKKKISSFHLPNFLKRYLEIFDIPKKELLLHALLSTGTVLATVLTYVVTFRAVGLPIREGIFLLVPILMILLTLPISIQGLGVREFMVIQYANFYHLNVEQAITASLAVFLVGIIYRVLGIFPFLFVKRTR